MSKLNLYRIGFNKRMMKVNDKYGYISLDSIVRSQYYFPFCNTRFHPIKQKDNRILYEDK